MPATPDYEFRVRDPRTLEYLGELRPQDVTARWTRRDVVAGNFEITIPRDRTDLSVIVDHAVIEILRDGLPEFYGVLELFTIDRLAKSWNLAGPDLFGFFLGLRTVGLVTPDNRSGIAEDLLIDYVDDNLGTGAASHRQIAVALETGFTIPVSGHRGPTVDEAATRRPLLAVVESCARAGDLLPTLGINSSGYVFGVDSPRDATQSSGAQPFGVDFDNVEELRFIKDFRQYRNDLYIMGDGAGAARNYTRVTDASSVAQHFLREGVLDSRYATSEAMRTAIGNLELGKRADALVRVAAKPLRSTAQARYRADFDVGWDVTFAESDLLSEALDVRIAGVTVSLNRVRGEDVTFELGQHRVGSEMRKIEEALAQLRVASFE